MSAAFSQALILVMTYIGGLYIGAVVVRFLLQAVRADFYNPVCQAIVKATSPLLNPLRRIVPSWRRLDLASVVLALLLTSLATAIMIFGSGYTTSVGKIISWGFVSVLAIVLNIYNYAMWISIIASFFAPVSGHPALQLIQQLLRPVYNQAHRVLPPMGGFDFSPLLLLLLIRVLRILVLNPLAVRLGIAPEFVIGL